MKQIVAICLLTTLLAACQQANQAQSENESQASAQLDSSTESGEEAINSDESNTKNSEAAAEEDENSAKNESGGATNSTESTVDLGTDPNDFVEGNLYFLAYHELGHALISEFDLPVLGREEDAVDRLATWMMTPEDKEEAPDYLTAAMQGWFITANDTPLHEIPWWDEHGTDQQRGFQIACLLYGAEPQRFKNVAETANLPETRRETCEFEAAQNEKAWQSVLAPYFTAENQAPSQKIKVIYEPSKKYSNQISYLKEIGLLENLAKFMAEEYQFKPGIKVVGRECGEANAFWNGDDRTISICYELVEDYRQIAGI